MRASFRALSVAVGACVLRRSFFAGVAVLAAWAAGGCESPVSPRDCSSLAVTPAASTAPGEGGEGRLTVVAPAGCAWEARPSAGWVQILSQAAGVGDGTVRYWLDTNTQSSSRQAIITVNSAALTITQEAAAQGCTYEVTPASRVVPSRSTGFYIRVFAPFGCRWTFAGNGGWLGVEPDSDGAPNGNGNGTVVGVAAENAGEAARTGSATVAGRQVSVRQDGTKVPACTFTLEPVSVDVGASGGAGQVSVTTTSDCAWNALTGGPDYAVVSPAATSGTGSGFVGFIVAANPGAAARSGSLVIRSVTGLGEGVLAVNQAGR